MRALLLALALAGCEDAPPPAPTSTPDSLPTAAPAAKIPDKLGLGRAASAETIAARDIDVRPDGQGLPPGSGTVEAGKGLFATHCAMCHGAAGEGGVGPKVIGPEPKTGFGEDWKSHPRTIGNWWPYATTVFDYVRRAMPQHAPGSLTNDQVYALTAFLLAENQIVGADFVADAKSLPAVKMGTKVTFIADDREESATVR